MVVSRFIVAESLGDGFLARAETALAVLGGRPGYRRGWVGRAADDPSRWVLVTEWAGVGAYRRALSAYDVKIAATPLLAESIDEPAAYEVLLDGNNSQPSDRASG